MPESPNRTAPSSSQHFAHRCPVCAPMQKAKTLFDAVVTARGPMMGRGSDRHYTETRTWPCGYVQSGDLYPYLLGDIFGGR